MDSPTVVLDELIRVGKTWATSQHQLVRLAARIDRSDMWERHGATSAAAWIAEVLDVEPGRFANGSASVVPSTGSR